MSIWNVGTCWGIGHAERIYERDDRGRLCLVCPRCGEGRARATLMQEQPGDPVITPLALPPIVEAKAIVAPKKRARKPKPGPRKIERIA